METNKSDLRKRQPFLIHRFWMSNTAVEREREQVCVPLLRSYQQVLEVLSADGSSDVFGVDLVGFNYTQTGSL
jgi:hypothetical protein